MNRKNTFVAVQSVVSAVFVVIGALYLFTEFDLPYVNSGDKVIVYIVTILRWALTSLAIVGWKCKSV